MHQKTPLRRAKLPQGLFYIISKKRDRREPPAVLLLIR